ncbi:MAG: amino-acid N-acetyltransferase [Nitrospirae bacterium]|nr:MAG: amino-acid N-acetyltransferase [Nitrospirota bacterium]
MEKSFIEWFRESSPYIHRFRGKTFVIAFDGRLILEGRLHSFVQDIALLNSLGIHTVIVYGAKLQIKKKMEEMGLGAFNKHPIIDEKLIEIIKEVVGAVRIDIEAALSMGVANSPMEKAKVKVSSGNFIVAKPIGVIDGVDYRFMGSVRSIDRDAVYKHIELGEVVLLSPIGYSITGEVFSIPYTDIALHASTLLKSNKLIFMVDSMGLLDDKNELIRELALDEAEQYLAEYAHNMTEEMRGILGLCIDACRGGVRRAHIINQTIEGALLKELFTRDGIGTMIASDTYAYIRSAKHSDIGGILRLIRPMEEKGVLIKRYREELENNISKFYVFEKDNVIVACGMLIPYEEDRTAEVGCLVVDPIDQNRGTGQRFLSYIEKQAKQRGFKRIFALSTQAIHWFQQQGYLLSTYDELPLKKKKAYNIKRGSKVLVKNL